MLTRAVFAFSFFRGVLFVLVFVSPLIVSDVLSELLLYLCVRVLFEASCFRYCSDMFFNKKLFNLFSFRVGLWFFVLDFLAALYV